MSYYYYLLLLLSLLLSSVKFVSDLEEDVNILQEC